MAIEFDKIRAGNGRITDESERELLAAVDAMRAGRGKEG